jgi:hypothetical protein
MKFINIININIIIFIWCIKLLLSWYNKFEMSICLSRKSLGILQKKIWRIGLDPRDPVFPKINPKRARNFQEDIRRPEKTSLKPGQAQIPGIKERSREN